jgi:hypothetical protein
MKAFLSLLALCVLASTLPAPAADWVTYKGQRGPGRGKNLVFITGDEEYRSEEGLPMMAKILSQRHGFNCTVLFPINPADGTIDPNNQTNVLGLHAIEKADLVFMLLRFREFPDDQMKYFVDHLNAGKPIIALRTSTHSFAYSRNKKSPYVKFDWQSREWPGGFGQQVLGDTWISHHGNHGHESTRGVFNAKYADDPILRGVTDVWGPTDVYGIVHLPADARVLVHGQVLSGMNPTDAPVDGPKNNPMMPLVWTREYHGESGKVNRILCTTMGAAPDLESEGLRRLLVNAVYWGLGMEKKIPAKANVDYVGEYHPTFFGFGKFKHGVKPADHELK